MNIAYVAHIRFPTEKAHGAQIAKMCEAFSRLGHSVELIVTDRHTSVVEDAFKYYDVDKVFKITRIPVPDITWMGPLGFWLQEYVFTRGALAVLTSAPRDVLYGRDERVLARFLRRGMASVVWESHTGSYNAAARYVLSCASATVVISGGLQRMYTDRGVPAARLFVAHDGVDLRAFERQESKEVARERLGLPLRGRIAMYIGRLDGWKGSSTLLESSKFLPETILLAIIGGEREQLLTLGNKYPRVRFLGPRPYRELANNEAAADVLVLPNTGTDVVSAEFTSPLKLFAYMASGRAIVVSDLPSLREVVNESMAFLCPPDNPAELAQTIAEAFGEEGIARARVAREAAREYTWEVRAKRILAFLAPLI